MTNGWLSANATASAGQLHAFVPEVEGLGRFVRRANVTDSALVLGSTQLADDLPVVGSMRNDHVVVRRRSGGGAVVVAPDAQLWFDVRLPRADDLVSDDVARTAYWLGHAIRRALESCGVSGLSVHEGPVSTTTWSRTVCFAGVGPGEVLVDTGNGLRRKLVGIAQRRNRAGVLLHVLVPRVWNGPNMAELLRLPPSAGVELADVAVSLDEFEVTTDQLYAQVLANLQSL